MVPSSSAQSTNDMRDDSYGSTPGNKVAVALIFFLGDRWPEMGGVRGSLEFPFDNHSCWFKKQMGHNHQMEKENVVIHCK
jgi:hypothetical protein